MTDKSHKTAISRKTLPLPTRWLLGRGLLKGVILDYGCGKCFELNNLFFVSDGYDPHYRKDGIEHSSYDTIICNFVLNVIESPAARQGVIDDIQYLLAPGGIAYISVRNDKEKLNGCTKRGTWQGLVEPPGHLIVCKPGWLMHVLYNGDA
jgi:ATP adenylyltransferase